MTPFVDLTSQESTSEGTKIDLRKSLKELLESNNSGVAVFLSPLPLFPAAFRVRYRWGFSVFLENLCLSHGEYHLCMYVWM